MTDVLKATYGPHAWQPFRADLPGVSGALLLMSDSSGFKEARQIASNRDMLSVIRAVRELYPYAELSEVVVGRKRYLARRPSGF